MGGEGGVCIVYQASCPHLGKMRGTSQGIGMEIVSYTLPFYSDIVR